MANKNNFIKFSINIIKIIILKIEKIFVLIFYNANAQMELSMKINSISAFG